MKLIIDIPEDVYTRLFDNGIQDNEIAVDDVCEMARALRLGTPLDDVKAEIGEETNMSKDEAIKILAAIRSDAIQGTCYVTESSAEALEMAIEALKR